MNDNYELDMSLTLEEAIAIIKNVNPTKIEISIGHYKTVQFIEKNSLTVDDIMVIIKSLDSSNYIKGPIPDNKPNEKRNKPVWIFKRNWNSKKLYIKIKIFITKNKVFVLSIHEDEEGDKRNGLN